MKKLLILVLSLIILCPWNYSFAANCAAEVDQATYNAAVDAVKESETSLCGGEGYYDNGTEKCRFNTPSDHSGGVWGAFKYLCFSDKIKGSCLYRKQLGSLDKEAAFCFISDKGGDTTPPAAKYCVEGGIKCPVSKKEDGDKFENRWVKRKRENNKGSGGCDGNWVGCCIKAAKVDRHASDSWWHSGQSEDMTDQQKDEMDLLGSFEEQDSSVANTCISLCSSYWTTLATLKTQQATLAAMCISAAPPCSDGDKKCDCETNQRGYWDSAVSKCICEGKQGAADFDACKCVKKTPAGAWTGGHCYSQGNIIPIEYDNNGNANTGSGGTNTNSASGGTDQSGSISGDAGTSASGMGDGAGKDNGGAVGASSSGQSWYDQLKSSLGLSSTASSGPKFGAKGSSQISGMNNNGQKKNTSTIGYASPDKDLFAMVEATYDSHEKNGDFLEFDANNNAGKSSSGSTKTPIKVHGTVPHVYTK